MYVVRYGQMQFFNFKNGHVIGSASHQTLIHSPEQDVLSGESWNPGLQLHL